MANRADDVQKIEEVLCASGIFQTHNATSMMATYFWQYIVPATNVGTAKDKDKTTVEYDDWEQALHERINGTDVNTVPVGESCIAADDDSIGSAVTENDV